MSANYKSYSFTYSIHGTRYNRELMIYFTNEDKIKEMLLENIQYSTDRKYPSTQRQLLVMLLQNFLWYWINVWKSQTLNLPQKTWFTEKF